MDLPSIPHTESRLAAIELPPFQEAITADVDSVMTAHLLIPAWDRQKPATLSANIVTDRLRKQLGFEGLVVTDALIMGGITQYASPEEVAVMAVEAGSDILLMPDNPEVAIASIYDAVTSGRIAEQRIQQSLERIWQAKNRVLTAAKSVSELSNPEARLTVDAIIQDSLQTSEAVLITDQNRDGRNLIVVDDVLNTTYLDLNSPAVTIPQRFNYQRQIVDINTLDYILVDSRPTLLQVFIRGNPFRGKAGLTTKTKQIYQQLMTNGQAVGIVIYGSPYVLEWFKSIMDSHLPWAFSYGQMEQAQAIALSALFCHDLDTLASKSQSNFGF